jgi:glycosyltransferase involved in cell wall biosynthesis
MNIFYIVESLGLGGSETQAVEAAVHLTLRGHLLCFGFLRGGPLCERLRSASIRAVEFPVTDFKSPKAIKQLVRLTRFFKKSNFDVVHAHDLYSNLIAVPAARMARVPRILSSQRDLGNWGWYTPFNRKILRTIQGLSTWVVANSDAVRQSLIHDDHFNPSRIQVVYNAVDVDRFRGVAGERGTVLPMTQENDVLVVMVANMNISPSKGHDTLVESARTVCVECPNVRFVLVGDGALRSQIETAVKMANLADHFVFLGKRTDVPRILAACDIAVLASNAEGLPNAVLEYLAAGLPTVATAVGGIPEIIEDGISGMLVAPQRPDVLAEAILRLIRDGDLRAKLSIGGRARVEKQFTYTKLISRLEALYDPVQRPGS